MRAIPLALLALGLIAAAPAQAEPRVHIDSGWLVGREEGPADVYKGVPFAAPPVGPLRWRSPQPVAPWSAPRVADRFGGACPQTMAHSVPKSEDCLALSIWAPRAAKRAPVMVWIHGGAHKQGDASQVYYDGASFARDGVVLVSVNYRLGGLGFFAHPAIDAEAKARGEPTGDFGILDQIAAMKWVQRNIAAFGGDPKNVTIFGESAGAVDVLYHLTLPASRGLFAKAIVESGGAARAITTRADKQREGQEIARRAGLSDTATAAELRALPAEKTVPPGANLGFGPFLDGDPVRESPSEVIAAGRAAHVPVIVGANSGEGSLMGAFPMGPATVFAIVGGRERVEALYPELKDDEARAKAVFRDGLFVEPARRTARGLAKSGPTWLYHFAYVAERSRPTNNGAGVQHGGEIPYAFDSWGRMPAITLSPADARVTAAIHAAWVRFARTGDPSGPELAWPRVTTKTTPTLVVGDPIRVEDDPRKAQLDAFAPH